MVSPLLASSSDTTCLSATRNVTKDIQTHQGADSSIRGAHETLNWPGMQAAILETWLSCGVCAQYLSEQLREPMKSLSWTWSTVRADLFQLNGSNHLVVVDHSDYFEPELLRNTLACTVIRVMKFAPYGIPEESITGNGLATISSWAINSLASTELTENHSPITVGETGKPNPLLRSQKGVKKIKRSWGSVTASLSISKHPPTGVKLSLCSAIDVSQISGHYPHRYQSTRPDFTSVNSSRTGKEQLELHQSCPGEWQPWELP